MIQYYKDIVEEYGWWFAICVFVNSFRARRCAHGVRHDGPECRECSW